MPHISPGASAPLPGLTTRRLTAIVTALLALALFVATMAPGLIAIEDTPKFQFIGRILGTAHPPGYPLYVMLTHVFGWLPIGNLAWRINLFSAICGSATAALLTLSAMELGVAPIIAAASGLALATGAGFWFAATIAEVYALHGTLVAAMIWALLRWRSTGRTAWFFAAITAFSLGLGHHTSIVVIGPAVALFAIALAPRFALAPRTIASILGLFALGFSQYLFVLIRTRQGVWGEAPASNLSELFDVIRGARWASYVAPFSMSTVTTRVPQVTAMLAHEVSWPVIAAAIVGGVVAIRRDRPLAALTVGAVAGVVAFAAFFAGQTEGFLQPTYFLVWLLAAYGVDAVRRWIPVPRVGAPVVALLVLGVALRNADANHAARDLSHRFFDMRYFDAVSREMPEHAAILSEDFLVDRMLLYEKFTQPAFVTRIAAPIAATPARVDEYRDRGYSLFAFEKSASALRGAGLAFQYASWPLAYGTLRQFLRDQPVGTVVALAVPALRLGPALAADAVPLDLVGGRVPAASWSNVAAIGVVGARTARQSAREKEPTSVFAAKGEPLDSGQAGSPADILAEASDERAAIRIGSRVIVASSEPVVAAWSPRGELLRAFALTGDGKVPVGDSALGLHRLREGSEWTGVGTSTADVTRVTASGHVLVRPSADGSPMILYAGRRRVLAPRLVGTSSQAQLRVSEYSGQSAELRESLARDGIEAGARLDGLPHVYRVEVPGSIGTAHLALGGVVDVALARARSAAGGAAVAPIDLVDELEPIDAHASRLHVARDHHQFFLANGWSPVSVDETGPYVLITAPDAELLVPCAPGECRTLDLQLWSERAGGMVDLSVNGAAMERKALTPGWQVYRWNVTPSALIGGSNAVVLQSTVPTRLGDVLVSRQPH